MTVHRYTDRFGNARHRIEVPLPGWAWKLALRAGAQRDPLEISSDQVRDVKPSHGRFDYWAATEAPKT